MTSIHSKLSRVRKPRVHITYDVETEGTTLKKSFLLWWVLWATLQAKILKH